MRKTVLVTVAAVFGLVVAGAASAQAATDPVGSVTIQLTTQSGTPLHLSGALVQLDESVFEPVAQTTSDASGLVRFTGILVGSSYDAVVLTTPDTVSASSAPGETDAVKVVAGGTTQVSVALPVGGTITGRLVTAAGLPAAGQIVEANGDGKRPSTVEVTTDATGRYQVDGLASEIVELYAYGSPQGFPTEWKTQVQAATATHAASHVTLSTRLVHTNYDLDVQVQSLKPTAALEGATVRAINASTGAVTDETTSSVLDSWQTAEWDLPSGSYRVEVITTATSSSPSKTYWFTSTYQLTATASAAVTIPVTYGGQRSYSETLPS